MADSFAQFPSFPKNLSYNLKVLQGSMIKNKLRINADQTEYKPNQIIRFNLPVGRYIDFRTIVLYCLEATTQGTGGIHFTRGGLYSLIQNLQITCNGRNLQTTNDYNFIWNLIADLEGYYSQEQASKRITELFDASLNYTYPNGSTAPTVVFQANSTTNDGAGTGDAKCFCVNNWLGFFNGSCATTDTNNMGNIQISITLAPSGALYYKTGATAPNDASYSLKQVFLTLDTITFTNSLYQDLIKSQLEGDGLNIGYYDYICQQLSSTSKSTAGINITTQINTNSLDQVIATFRPNAYDTIGELLLGTGTTGTLRSYNEIVNTPLTTSAGAGTNGLGTHGAFCQNKFLRRDGTGFDSSVFYINSQPFTVSSSPIEVFNNTLQSLSFNNLDVGCGIHPGCHSLGHFCRNYFADILSLENQDNSGNWIISGLSGNSSTIQVGYNAKFVGNTDTVFPVLIMRVSKRLNIKLGRALDLYE